MSIKEILLQKGWAGRTISRPETVIRMNPLIQVMSNLLYAYNCQAEAEPSSFGESSTGDLVRILRMDIGKMCETVASCGGISTRSPEISLVEGSTNWSDITAVEKSLMDMITAEKEIEHHMRSRAILSKVAENTERRLQQLESLVQA